MRAPKLPRLRSSHDVSPTSPNLNNDHEPTFKASFDDLRSPNSREVLRQHLTGAFFPDMQRKTSQEWHNGGSEQSLKDRRMQSSSTLGVGQNAAAKSSTSSVETPTGNKQRLSVVPESQPTIDIAQAIQLLQELKKTASPEELVALHKALLPTRDSIVVTPIPNNEDRFSSSSLIRRGSLQPAGLATRGGASVDILRRQDEVTTNDKYRKSHASMAARIKNKGSQSSLAALDLADDSQAITQPRAKTPVEDEYLPFGHYRPGTLRITNGAASPEPSIATLRTMDMEPTHDSVHVSDTREQPSLAALRTMDLNPPLEPVHTRETRASADYATAPTTPVYGESLEQLPAATFAGPTLNHRESFQTTATHPDSASNSPRQVRPRNSSVSGIPHPRERDESVPRVYKRQWQHASRDPSQPRPAPRRRSQSLTPRSRDPSASRLPLRTERRESIEVSHKVSAQSLEQIRTSLDDGRVSPLPDGTPRWSHRASQISQEYVSDCEISASPYDVRHASYAEREAMWKRLSTVYDKEDDSEASAQETREAALAKLNGDSVDRPKDIRLQMPANNSSYLHSPMTSPRSGYFPRPSPLQKQDSGYATDTSSQAKQSRSLEVITDQPSNRQLHADEGIGLDAGEVQSLYTMEEILKSPTLLSAIAPQSPSQATSSPQTPAKKHRKHSSLLKLASSRKASAVTLASSSPVAELPAENSSPEMSKVANKLQKKRLQKPMPEAVKAAMREQRRKEKALKAAEEQEKQKASALTSPPASDLPEVVDGVGRFDFEPGATNTAAQAEGIPDVMQIMDGPEQSSTQSLPQERHSKSRGRDLQRSSSTRQFEDNTDKERRRSWGMRRSLTPKSVGSTPTKAIDGDVDAPMWTDYSSVARTLGSNPYDPATTLVKTVVARREMQTSFESPHHISTTVSRSKTGGLQGMDSGMASELARMKSRDMAVGTRDDVADRPRTATPRKRSVRGSVQAQGVHPAMRGGNEPGSQQNPIELGERPMSMYAESIPPLPELPAQVKRVVEKVDLMVAKRIKDSAQPPPEKADMMAAKRIKDSAQPSPADSARSSDERSGHSTLSVAEAVWRAMERSQERKEIRQDEAGEGAEEVVRSSSSSRKRPVGPRQQSSSSLQVQVREILRTTSAESIPIALGSDVDVAEGDVTAPAESGESDPASSQWAEQAKAWKKRRQSAGETLGKPSVDIDEQTAAFPQPPKSPAVVVSRYITPTADETAQAAKKRRKSSAADQAKEYQSLIEEDMENQPTDSETAPAVHAPAYSSPAVKQEFQPAPPPSDRALLPSQQAHRGPIIERARSPGGRVITSSGNYHPFTPADAAKAEQSRRAESVAKLTAGVARRKGQSLDVPRESSSRDGTTTTTTTTTTTVTTSVEKNGGVVVVDRYSGGLEYGYERGVGLGGSAGMRVKGDEGARRSRELAEGWGVDLSDVPVFLRRVT